MVDLSEEHTETSLWNMAQATLMRLNDLILRIQEASLGCIVSQQGMKICKTAEELGDLQLIKYRLMKQFVWQAIPLLKKEDGNKIRKQFKEIEVPKPGKAIYPDGTDAGMRMQASMLSMCRILSRTMLFLLAS